MTNGSSEPIRVLLAEDGPDNVRLISHVLRKAGASVTTVGNGEELLAAMTVDGDAASALRPHLGFDLIITDLHMPNKNGDDILKLVREDMKSTIPIVMFSSDGEEEVIALALKLGINDFIVKPVTVEKFLKKIKKYLK